MSHSSLRARKTRRRRLTSDIRVSRRELGALELAERLTALARSPGGIQFDVPLDYAEMRAAEHGIAPQAIRAALDHINRQHDRLTSTHERRRPAMPHETTVPPQLRSGATEPANGCIAS